LFTLAVQTVWQKKLRTLLTIVGIAVCANLFIIVTSIVGYLDEDMDRQVRTFAGQLIVQERAQGGVAGLEWPPTTSAVRQDLAEQVLATQPVVSDRSAALLFSALAPPPYTSAPPEAFIVGVTPGFEKGFVGDTAARRGVGTLSGTPDEVILGLVSGRFLAQTASSTFDVATSAGTFSVPAVGSTVQVKGESFRVVGYMDPETNQLYRSLVMMPLATAQRLSGREGFVSAIMITPRSVGDIDAIKQNIERDYPTLAAYNNEELAANAGRILSTTQQFMNVVRVTVVVVAALIVMIVMFVSVLERTREIGTLRAVGAPGLAILRLILVESLFMAFVGGIIGIPMSIAVLKFGISDGGALVSRVSWAQATGLLALVGVAASLLPAYRAVRVDPLVALRYE
jgi:putative ABC transport system permease protein